MSRFLVAIAAAAFGFTAIQSASAADMPARYTKAPPLAPMFNWSGFYIGGFVGAAAAARDVTSTEPVSAVGIFYNAPLANSYSLAKSFIGGGTVGWNYQPVRSPWLFGVEAEVGYIRLRRTIEDINAINAGFAYPDSLDITRLGDWYGVAAGRLGYTSGQFLIYGKAGVAVVKKDYSYNDSCSAAPCGPSQLVLGRSNTFVTWAAGAGIEYALNNTWSIKGEYLYLATQETITSTGVIATGPGAGAALSNVHTDPGIHTGKIGINYRFGSY